MIDEKKRELAIQYGKTLFQSNGVTEDVIRELQKLEDAGCSDAAMFLGINEQKDTEKRKAHLMRAIELGEHPAALLGMATVCMAEANAKRNKSQREKFCKEAQEYTHRAMQKGLPYAYVILSQYASHEGRIIEAFYWMYLAMANNSEGAPDSIVSTVQAWGKEAKRTTKYIESPWPEFTEQENEASVAVLRVITSRKDYPKKELDAVKLLADKGSTIAQVFMCVNLMDEGKEKEALPYASALKEKGSIMGIRFCMMIQTNECMAKYKDEEKIKESILQICQDGIEVGDPYSIFMMAEMEKLFGDFELALAYVQIAANRGLHQSLIRQFMSDGVDTDKDDDPYGTYEDPFDGPYTGYAKDKYQPQLKKDDDGKFFVDMTNLPFKS